MVGDVAAPSSSIQLSYLLLASVVVHWTQPRLYQLVLSVFEREIAIVSRNSRLTKR